MKGGEAASLISPWDTFLEKYGIESMFEYCSRNFLGFVRRTPIA